MMRVTPVTVVVLALAVAPFAGNGALAQQSGPTPRLTGAVPAELMVDPRSGRTTVTLHGDNINDDLIWTPRLYRYYVRRAGESTWRRIYINPQGPGMESAADLSHLRANGEGVGWSDGVRVLELPNPLYFGSPGALEFRVERGEWKRREEKDEDGKTFINTYYASAAVSNTLRVPIRAAPTAAPVVTRLDPPHVPVLGRGMERAVITVYANNLTPGAQVMVGTEPCEVGKGDPVRGWVECVVPAALQSNAGMYLVGVSTANGGARQLGRLTVQAPLQLARPDPSILPVADTGAAVEVAYQGGAPLGVRLRVQGGGWTVATFSAEGARAVRVEVPASLTRGPGALELELRNAAGVAVAPVLVCGPGGEQPRGCPRSVAARPGALNAAGAPIQQPRAPAQRAPIVVDPRDPVSLRPQPEPPGLTGMTLAATATLRLSDGNTVAWRRIDGAARLVLLDPSGKAVKVFDPSARLARDGSGKVYVRVANGVVPVGQVRRELR
jgi:hypothetical protein